jgi:hypothetical protein
MSKTLNVPGQHTNFTDDMQLNENDGAVKGDTGNMSKSTNVGGSGKKICN